PQGKPWNTVPRPGRESAGLSYSIRFPARRRSWTRGELLPLVDDLGDHLVDLVHRQREADAGPRPGRAEDGGIDADQPAAAVQERPARIARVDGRRGLDDAGDGHPRA